MLKIGDFSKLSRISVRMLRHYDEVGLIHPVRTDPVSGYRYYDEGQLILAGRIASLRDMGFGLAGIADLLREQDRARVRERFELHYAELRGQAEEIGKKLRHTELQLARLGKDEDMKAYSYVVSVKELPARYVASVRSVLENYNYEGRLWHILMSETKDQNLQPDDPCLAFGLYHDEEYKEYDVDVEIQMTVSGRYQDTEHVTFKEVPAVFVASAMHYGSYEEIQRANAAVVAWIEANGYEMNGQMFNIYHVSPHETQNPDELVTEVCYPVCRR